MDMWTGPLVDMNVHLPLDGPGRIVDLSVRLENGMALHHPLSAFSMVKTHGGVGYRNDVSTAMVMRDLETLISTETETFGFFAIPLRMGGDTESPARLPRSHPDNERRRVIAPTHNFAHSSQEERSHDN